MKTIRILSTGPAPKATMQRAGRANRVYLALLLFAAVASAQGQLPDLITYNFSVAETKTLPAGSSAPGAPCNGTIAAADQIQSLALASLFYQNGCYTDGQYNHRNYQVDRGTVSGSGGGAANLAAYRVYEPQNKATQFLGSQTGLFYRFPTIADYTVYTLAGGTLTKVVDVPAASIPNTTDFIPINVSGTAISVSPIVGSVTYVFALTSTAVSSFTSLGAGVEGARVASTAFGDVLKYRYSVSGTPYDSATDFASGPGGFDNSYSNARRFFPVRNANAGLGAVWQNQSDLSLKLTWFGADRKTPTTVSLANPQAQLLACATGDDAGNVYFLTIQSGSGAPNNVRSATLTKAGPTGTTLSTTALDTTVNGLNMVEFFKVASLKYLNGKIGLMLGRIMTQTGDGLNHQGGIAVVFDATTLGVDFNWGQTSGHSFDNVLASNTNGQFVAIDLGDNFPRGINLHKFNSASIYSRVISSYKTQHGTTALSPDGNTYPVYTEISGGGTTYYRWSNDNNTYTELGGVAQTALGYAVCFVGERSPNGRLIDNARVGGYLNDPRNIGFIAIREDFQNATGNQLPNYNNMIVTDDLVQTTGLVETNGFYSFAGTWTPQRNAGVVWLSSYPDLTQNASRLKLASRADGRLVLLWEVWTASSYVATKGMTVSANGTIVNAQADLSSQVRLGRREDPYALSNSVYIVAGSKPDSKLELIVIETPSAAAPGITTLAATAVTSNSATLNGSANPNGLAAIGFFQWGTTVGYGQSTVPVNLGNGTGAVALSTAISGLTAGVTYHFRAAASNSVGVVFGNDFSFTPTNPPVVPDVTTLAATAVTSSAATLNGSANPNGLAAIGFFQWGTTVSYGQSTAPANLGNGTGALALSTAISGLTAGVTYHFRAAASNSVGVVFGNDLSFTPTNPAVGPGITTLAATAVTNNSATLNGSGNPNGVAAIGFFEWGATVGYGQSTASVNLGNGTGPVPLSASLSWLTAGVTYHFRAVTSNSVSVVYGNDLTFTPQPVFSPPISTFTGGDPGEGLDLTGTFPFAVNVGGNGAPGLIGEANFTTDSAPDVSITAPGGTINTLDTWANPVFGTSLNDMRLVQAMSSIRWTAYPAKLTVTLSNLLVGRSYKLQLMFIEGCCDHVQDVRVNGALVVTAFRFFDYGPVGTPLLITHTFTAASTTAVIELGGGTVPAGLDGNPTLSAFTLELAPANNPAGLTITRSGSTVTIDWPAAMSGVLQETLSLTPPAWHNVPGGSAHPITLPATNGTAFYRLANPTNPRWATRVLGFSSQFSSTVWGATQALGQPDTYPAYGDIGTAWSSLAADDPTEYIELGYDAPAPINSVSIYETYGPGAVSKVSVRNPTNGLWVQVWSGTAAPAPAVARIFNVAFPQTSFPVDAIRIDLNSGAVPDYNEIDAVSITSNDDFENRTPLSGAPLAISASNEGATKETAGGEPNHTGNFGGRSLWWSWTAPSNGSVTLSCQGSSFDTLLAVYTGTALNALTQVAANDDFNGNIFSQVTFTATQNVTYQIAVDGFNFGSGAAYGTIQLNLTMP